MDDQHGTVRQVRVLLMSLVFMFAACGDLPQISELPLEATEMDEIKGIWEGALDVRGTKLRLVFHIDAEEKVLTARMDSPDQGLRDIPIADVRYDGSRLMLESEQFGLTYDGTVVEPDRIDGVFYQRGYEVKLALSRVDAPTERSRPQDPGEPLPYQVEEVSFESQVEGSTLAGSLTLPPETRAVAVLVSGSGQQDRDSTIMGHRPFLVLADHLSRAGVAVLRYDDRGLGGSTGPLDSATSRNFANDASAALDFLKAARASLTSLSGSSVTAEAD